MCKIAFLRCWLTILLSLICCTCAFADIQKIWIAGDSTAASYKEPDHQGWAALLENYIDANKAQVINRAKGGRSSRTFITEGHWQGIINEVSAGDIVIIQFGHNDAGAVNDDNRARGTLPGTGEEFVDIDNQLTKKPERVYSYGHYIREMVSDVRKKNATPILMSLTVRNIWQAGHIERGSGKYGRWAYDLAWELNTPFIDLTNAVADKLEALGETKTALFYTKDHTHFNPQGALIHVETAVAAFKNMRPDLFNSVLSEKGQAIAKDEWTWLRLPFPADTNLRSIFLIGDSTVRNGGGDGNNGEWGWGDYLAQNLDTKKFNVVNRAVGGLSSRTFLTGGYWQRTLNMMRPGDVLIMQFGHNDSAPINDETRSRGTIPGVADSFDVIENKVTGKTETVHSYGWYLRNFIGEAKARGITTIVCSPVPRSKWKNNRIERAENSYPEWARLVALQSGSPFIDLHENIANQYDLLGQKKVKELFADEHTHTSKTGAELNAKIVSKELKPILGL
ncbi:MAG: rhamnogalacturonan acetylesterase [Cellvibrio sp.]